MAWSRYSRLYLCNRTFSLGASSRAHSDNLGVFQYITLIACAPVSMLESAKLPGQWGTFYWPNTNIFLLLSYPAAVGGGYVKSKEKEAEKERREASNR